MYVEYIILGMILSFTYSVWKNNIKIEQHIEEVKLENIRLLDLLTDLEHELRKMNNQEVDKHE